MSFLRPRNGAPKQDRRRSVYEKPVDDDEIEPSWERIGEIDPATGQGHVDYSRIGGWRPLHEFLWRR